MNETHKKTLRIHHPDLTRDLDLTADLAGKLIHSGILNEDMVEEVKNERTRKDRVQKLLFILPRRGPRAFDKFVCALQEHYWWLADDLRKTYHKISLHTEPEMLSLKKKVDIYVHERFGSSKRLCEDDKKEIRQFLYSHLKSHKEEDDPLFAVEQSRRNSLESNASDFKNLSGVNEKDIEINILSRVYSLLKGDSDDDDETDGFDAVDGPAEVITMDMVEKKVNELNNKIDTLQNEINNCYSVLGMEYTEQQPLDEVLKSIKDDRKVERKRLDRMREKLHGLECELEAREEEISALEKKLHDKGQELNDNMNRLADEEHKSEKADVQMRELKEKCLKLTESNQKLEKLHLKHLEKQQTLMALKNMVNELSPQSKQCNDPVWTKKRQDNCKDSLQLPKLSPVRVNRHGRQSGLRQSHQINHSDEETSNSNEFLKQRASHHVLPWK